MLQWLINVVFVFVFGLIGVLLMIYFMIVEMNILVVVVVLIGLLFYCQIVLLSVEVYVNWCLCIELVSFVVGINLLLVVVGEFGLIVQFYLILFIGKEVVFLVVVGLVKDNLFVIDGYWVVDYYVLVYVCCYLFVFIQIDDLQNYVLGLDVEVEQVNQGDFDEGQLLFENGELIELVNVVMCFCGDFICEYELICQFSVVLIEQGLLVDCSIDVILFNGVQMLINGFCVVDVEKFFKLLDVLVVVWYCNGWLVLVYYYLSLLVCFNVLVQCQSVVLLFVVV